MTKQEIESLFCLAGFTIYKIWELPNGYWPRHDLECIQRYYEIAKPWWLVMTQFGPIEIGWRKRVISIRWDATNVRAIVTSDNVTKEETLVHAWGIEFALVYLRMLRIEGDKLAKETVKL